MRAAIGRALGAAMSILSMTAAPEAAPETAPKAKSNLAAISSYPQNLTAVDDALYFSADDGVHGRELWIWDSHTTHLAADVEPGPDSSNPEGFRSAGSLLFFCATTRAAGTEPWVYDRVEEKARLVKDTVPGSASAKPAFGGVGPNGVYLLTKPSTGTGCDLWTIRLSPVEAVFVSDLPSTTEEYSHATLPDGQFFFSMEVCLLRSDGTPEGTQTLYRAERPANIQWITALNDRVVFMADAPGCGSELWVSNGTAEGTQTICDIRPGEIGSSIGQIYAHNGLAFFQADDGNHGLELWVTDGTTQGTRLVKDINAGPAGSDPHYFLGIGGDTYFVATDVESGIEVWRTDGTDRGTTRISNLTAQSGGGAVWSLAHRNNVLYFCADSAEFGEEVFQYDINKGQVGLLDEAVPGPLGSGPGNLVALPRSMFFTCDDGVHGEELWATPGWASPTAIVKDIRTLRPSQSASSSPRGLAAFGGKLLFSAVEMAHGLEPWVSDGTAGGTVLVKDIAQGRLDSAPRDFTVLGGRAFFSAETPGAGRELHVTDGTFDGTRLVRDLRPGPAGANPCDLVVAGGTLFFLADDGVVGREIWCSDGSSEGTRLVADMTEGESGSSVEDCTPYQGALYCTMRDARVVRIDPATLELQTVDAGFHPPSAEVELMGDRFFAAYTPEHGREVWKSEKDTGETILLADIFPGRASSGPTHFTTLGETVFFIAEHPQEGRVLFQSDGTPANTVICRPFKPNGTPWPTVQAVDIARLDERRAILIAPHPTLGVPGEPGLQVLTMDGGRMVLQMMDLATIAASHLDQLTSSGGLVYFTYDDSVYGEELWATDGTKPGTRIIKDILRPSAGSANNAP